MTDSSARNRAMVERLRADGSVTSAAVEAAMLAVPRHRFAPATGWFSPDQQAGPGRRIDLHAAPGAWWDAVYADGSIVTQRADGAAPADAPAGTPSSSLSAPGVVARFLELLAPRPGERVLEIGTGTGWTAALLAELLTAGGTAAAPPDSAAGRVISVEVDPHIAAQAAARLKATGHADPGPVDLVVGDGAFGHWDGAPYDRVHATCAVARVPPAWIAQTRPGGVIVVPWQPAAGIGRKLRLVTTTRPGADTAPGGSTHATGRLHGPVGYMMLRAQRTRARWNPHHAADATTRSTGLDPRVFADPGSGLMMAVTAFCPRVDLLPMPEPDGSFSLLLTETDAPDGAWAACDAPPGASRFEVTQYGARRLWDEAETAHRRWHEQGRPGDERYGLTVTHYTTRIWLDHPDHVLTA